MPSCFPASGFIKVAVNEMSPPKPLSTEARLSAADPGLLPVFALKAGLIGNRRFGAGHGDQGAASSDTLVAQAKAACEAVWEEMLRGMSAIRASPLLAAEDDTEILSAFFAPGPARLGVLTSLAAGADQFGARAALEAARRVGESGSARPEVAVHLEGILPFSAADYPGPVESPRPEFTLEEAAEFESLAAACVQTVCLGGVYGQPDDPAWESSRQEGYGQARDMVLQHSDVLVAVYDPVPAAKKSGTRETVQMALKGGTPVVAVLVSPEGPRIGVWSQVGDHSDDGDLPSFPLDDLGWQTSLHSLLCQLLGFPYTLAPEGEGEHERRVRLRAYREAKERLRVFFARDMPTHAVFRFVVETVFTLSWRFVGWLGGLCCRAHGFRRHRLTPPQPLADEAVLAPHQQFILRADLLSQFYMKVYRGAFPLAFFLAGLATSTAVTMLVVTWWTGGHPSWQTVVGLGSLKISILLFLLWLEHTAHHHRWQERGTEYRYLVELLRPVRWLSPLGTQMPVIDLPAQYAPLNPRQGWVHWLFRAVARAQPPVAFASPATTNPATPRTVEFSFETARQALASVRDGWLEGQRLYHWQAAQANHRIENGLERISKALLYGVLCCAVVALGLELIELRIDPLPPLLETFLPPTVMVLTALAAALPAFIAALGAIISQSEAKRLELRSEAMFHGLQAQQRLLDAMLKNWEKYPATQGGATWELAQKLRVLAALMISETSDWKVLYQTQDIKAG